MKSCAASACTNTSFNSPHLTWHSLPQDSLLRDDWMDLLGIPDDDDDMDPPKICSSHFKPNDFLSNNRFLKSAARPSVRLAKTARPPPIDKDDMDDYVASSSEDDVTIVSAKEEAAKVEIPTSTRPSRKAAQKAAEKLKRYCYESPPNSPAAPSTSRNVNRQPPVTHSQTPNLLPAAGTKMQISGNRSVGSPVTLVHGSTLKFMSGITPIHSIRPAGVNVTHLPLMKKTTTIEDDSLSKRRVPIFERAGIHITLQMECYEELLTPAQVSKHQKMQADAETFNQTLRSFRAANISVVHCNDPFVKVTNTVTMVTSQMSNGIGNNALGTKTTDVIKSTPSVLQRINPPNTLIRPPVLIQQPMQQMHVLRPGAPQQAIILAPQNNVTNLSTGIPGQQLSYKVLVDSRTGIVVGAMPQGVTPTVVSTPQAQLQQPAPQANIQPQTINSGGSKMVKSIEPTKSVTPIAPKNTKTPPGPPGIPDGCVLVLEGGTTEVTAESLLAIKAISGSRSKWFKALKTGKPLLQTELEREKFFTEPLRWMINMNLVLAESNCRSCGEGKLCLIADSEATDGFKWLCNKPVCAKHMTVQRLYFFSRFGSSLNRLLPLVFHWAMQTEIDEVKAHLKVDTYVIRSIWRALQEVCTRAVVIKAKKLGGPGKVVEIVTAKLGPNFWVIAAFERKSGYVRLKVVRTERDWNTFANLQKILEPWLMSKTVIMSPETALRGLGRIGYVFTQVEKNVPQSNAKVLIHAVNVTKYIKKHLTKMFGQFKLSEMKLDTVQGFLDELQWRNRFGKTPRDSFCYIFKDIAEQSGRMVSFPPAKLSGKSENSPLQVTISSDSSSSSSDSDDVSSVDSSPSSFRSSPLADKQKQKAVSSPAVSNSKQQKSSPTETAVVLDSYYYATKGPDPELVIAEVKGSFQFKCIICKKVIDNNLKVMKHLVAHIENNRQRNPDLSDLTQCKYCFRDFDTPYSMQCHMETVHLNTSALSCQICNHAFNSSKNLCSHMRWTHVKAEMPYSCQICNYRSSFQRDVLDHFQQAHNNTDKLLCHYCLRVYVIRFNGPEQLGNLQNYYYHLYKHQCKSSTKKCHSCCLVFPTINEMKKHIAMDHVSYQKDKMITYGTPKMGKDVVLVKEPHMKETMPPGLQKKPGRMGKVFKLSDMDQPSTSRDYTDMDDGEPLVLPPEFSVHTCVECNNSIDPDHFLQSVSCSKCKYTTMCTKAFVEHMICQHSRTNKKRKACFVFTPLTLDKFFFCPCGFQSDEGNVLANHLKGCGRKSCYPDWMKAVNSLVKVEPGQEGNPPLERGSAFFAPLVVLDENEAEYVNQTLSTIPEPKPGIKEGVAGRSRRKRSRDSQEQAEVGAVVSPVKGPSAKAKKVCEEEQPSWLSALGLFRKSGGDDDSTDSTPAVALAEDKAEEMPSSVNSPDLDDEDSEMKGSDDETPEEPTTEAPSPQVDDEESPPDSPSAVDDAETPEQKRAKSSSPKAQANKRVDSSKVDESIPVRTEEENIESPVDSDVTSPKVDTVDEEPVEMPDNQKDVDSDLKHPDSETEVSSSKCETDQINVPVLKD